MSSRWTRWLVAALLLMTVALPASTHSPLTGLAAASGAPLAPAADRSALPTDPNDGVAWTNYLRSFGENLAPVTTSAALSDGPQRHAEWLAAFHAAGDPYCDHGMDATHTWPAGENHEHNVLYCGPTTLGAAVQGWVDTPYHGAGFVDPATTAIGFGFAGDTSTGLFAENGTPALSRWPKPGGVLPSPAMTTGESPDPKAACGYPPGWVGRPIFLSLPAPAAFVASSIVGPSGPVAHCALHANPFEPGAPILEAGETTGQVALLAQFPYDQRQTYTVTIAMSTGTTEWSFTVGDAPGAPAVTAAPSGPGELTVSWQPADGHGLPITSYRVDDVTSGQSQVVAGTQSSATFGGVPIGVQHEFRVVATNDLGDGPPGSAAAVAIDGPDAPVIVSIVPGSASAFLSWTFTTRDAAPVTGFQVQLDDEPPLSVGYVTERTLAALQAGHTYTVRVRATNMVVAGAWSEPRTVTPTAAGRLFHGLPLPMRAVDTRSASGPIAPGAVLAVPVVAATGVTPSVVAAISMNLTATNATGPGYFTAWPCDQPQPLASSLNYGGGEPGVPNHAIVPVARDGTVCITTGVHAADVIVDVDGWFSFAAGLAPETPRRALDTRPTGPATDVTVAAVPAGSFAAVVNLTAAGGSGAPGFVTAYPCGTAVPLASNLNFDAGQVVANAAVVPVAPDGSLCLHASTATNLVVDVAGAVTDNYLASTPTRLLDSRLHDGPLTEAIVAATPAGAAAAILNVTAAGGSTADGFITVYPADVPLPPTSNVNFRAGQVVPNAVVVHPDATGAVKLTASTAVQVVVDTFGAFL